MFIYVPVSSYCRLTRSIKDVDNNFDNNNGIATVDNRIRNGVTNVNSGSKTRSGRVARSMMDDTTTVDNCDQLNCDNESERDDVIVCATTNTGAIATFRSECGVKLLNCYQRLYAAAQYRIVSRKACAHKNIWYLRGHCDRLICENNGQQYHYLLAGGDDGNGRVVQQQQQQQPPTEKRVCATNGDSMALFKSACHVEVLNCYQKMYRKPSKK